MSLIKKVNITYGNSCCIPTGVPYEQLKPFYSINKEIEINADEMTDLQLKYHIGELKTLIDGMILEDIKKYRLRSGVIKSEAVKK